MGRRSYDLSSTALDRRDPRQCSSMSNNRIAIIVAIVLAAGAVIAGIVVAVYFTSIPASQNKSDAITNLEISKIKAFQGEVKIEQEWNEILKDPNSDLSKEKVRNFTSAMGAVCRHSPGYNSTVVDGFRNGSIVVKYRILWVAKFVKETDTSEAVNENGQQGHVTSETEINPVDIAKLMKLIKDELPKQLGTVVTYVSELEEVTASISAESSTTFLVPTSTRTTTTKQPVTSTIPTSTNVRPTTNNTLKPTTTSTTAAIEPSIITTAAPIGTNDTTIITPKSRASIAKNNTLKPTTIAITIKSTPERTRATTINKISSTTITSTVSLFKSSFTSTSRINRPEPITSNITRDPTTSYSTISSSIPKPVTTDASTNHGVKTTSNPCQEVAVTLACHFEDSCLCGYRNVRNDTLWYQRSGHFFKLPRYDHTYGSDTGQFMIAYNTSDLAEYYNKFLLSVPGFPYRLEYSNSTFISPRVNMTTESCVYFYYYLNGTAVRANPLSAQLFVYVNGNNGRRLVWYDHINRTVSDWLKGWVPVQSGYAEVIFVAKTITTTTVWPGVVALDDVSVIYSPCPANPNCGPDTFQCNTTRVCISVYLQCDGSNDCLDGSDEENCISKPDNQIKLINGDGSYGSIGIFYHGLWRPVCMSKNSLAAGNSNIVQLTCKHVGYTGRYQGTFVNSWHQPVQYAVEISCSSYSTDISNCTMNLTQTNENTSSCYYYQAAICSNDECFSGERICPLNDTYSNFSSITKCISYQYFCDGIYDCPGDTDELNCANCSTSEFECTNHECIPVSQRCDGTQHCGDKSDEYGCVIIVNNVPQMYHTHLSAYLPVCYNSINDTVANILCSLCGEGVSRHFQQHDYVPKGTMLVPLTNSTISSLVSGYAVSIETCFSAMLQCTSFECGTTTFDDVKFPKVLFGRDPLLGQLPWHIGLYINGECCCGGSIVHPNWVITAAHCTIYTDSYTIIAGAVEVGLINAKSYEGQLYNSSRLYKNPLYNSDYDNDNSLIYVQHPIVFNNYVRPICIASRRTVDEMIKAGYNTECYVSGWGRSQNVINRVMWLGKLQMVRVYLYNKDECNQIYYDVFGSYPQNTTVCVDNQNLGSPACHGDSGGSLICRNKYGRFELLGTLSWGYNSCFKDGFPDIYQLSYPHASWIEQTTGLQFSDLTMDMD